MTSFWSSFHFSSAVCHSGANQLSTSATLADSGTLAGCSWAASHASGLPAARSFASACWVNPLPSRFRNSRSRLVATGSELAQVVGSGVGVGVVGGLGVAVGGLGTGFGAGATTLGGLWCRT